MKLYETVTGRHFLDRMRQLDKTQWLDRSELLALQRQKLHRLLDYAYQYVPYYGRAFDQAGFRPSDILQDPTSFQRIPYLTKALIRENFDDLITTEASRRRGLNESSTAGSTGQPLVFMQDTAFRDQATAELHHHLTWSGWTFGEPHAYIFGASFEAGYARNLRARLMNLLLNRFIVNAYVLSEEGMHEFAAEAMSRRPQLLFGYASSLFRFAQFLGQNAQYDLSFVEAVFSTSEVLYPAQRELVAETLGCQVFNRYATRELGALACECEAHTGLHTSFENAYIELLKDGAPAESGEAGDMVVTNLSNFGMPLIRYQLADAAEWHPEQYCPCGRSHPMIKIVEGRHNDLLRRRDGGYVWGGIGNPLWTIQGVSKFQFIQKSLDYVVVRVVKDEPLSENQQNAVETAVKTALGDHVRLDFEFPDDIPVERSGKHRYQICEVAD
jgi:phenylacetate-CoA ligase